MWGGTIWLKEGTGTLDKYYYYNVLLLYFSATTGKVRCGLIVVCIYLRSKLLVLDSPAQRRAGVHARVPNADISICDGN